METVSNMANAAAKAVWGDNTTAKNETTGQEPISGQKGDVSRGEPYDQGNADLATQTQTAAANTELPPATPATELGQTAPQVTTGPVADSTDAITKPAGDAAPGAAGEFAKTTGTAAESDQVPDNAQTALKAKDTPQDTTKEQNDTRSPDDPQTHPKNAPTDVDNTGDGPNEAQKLDGPGPRSLDELAHERGGDAGKVGAGGGPATSSASSEKKDVDPNDPSAPSSGEGTGEKHVKTTGFQADGGDFDATKPGAGREADRLLEQKGIHKDTGDKPSSDAASGGSGDKDKSSEKSGEKSEKSEKKNPFSKLKEKLHKH